MLPYERRSSVVVLLPVVGQPRHAKRIEMLKMLDIDVKCLAFDREYHRSRIPGCSVELLGRISAKAYWRRICTYFVSVMKLRKAAKYADLVYVFGTDLAGLFLLSRLGLRTKFVAEIGDIREIETRRGLVGRVVRFLAGMILSRATFLVVTSEDFLKEYIEKWLNVYSLTQVIENKVERSEMPEMVVRSHPKAPDEQPGRIRIGYFGRLRCEWSWSVLKAIAQNLDSRFSILTAGYIPPGLVSISELEELSISYHGEYKSPSDLGHLYGSVNFVWSCYKPIAPDDWNLRWARTNRFYEACFYKVPIIARAGSNDGKWVGRYGIGLTLDQFDATSVLCELEGIGWDQVNQWKKRMQELPDSVYCLSGERDSFRNNIERAGIYVGSRKTQHS